MNFHSSIPIPLRALTQVAVAVLLVLGTAQAQTSASKQVSEREKTRARILDITGDQAQDLDTRMDLGRSLASPLPQNLERLDSASTAQTPLRAASPRNSAGQDGAPTVPVPPTRVARRAAPDIDDTKPVYTPDFSRQVMSFAQLLGRDTVDLPRSDAGQTSPNTPALSDAASTWGLPDIVAEGLSVSPVQAQLQANMEVAQAQKFQARADFFPTASLQLAAGNTKTEPGGLSDKGYQNHTLRLNQPIYNAPIWHNYRSADLAQQAAQLRTTDGLETVALSAIQATVNLAAARLTINFADDQETQLINVLQYLETRTQAGAASQADLNRARTRLAAAKQTRLEQQASYKSTLYELERLIEQKPNYLRLPYLNQLTALPSTKQEILEIVRKSNVVLNALQKDVDAQLAVVASQSARLQPVVALSVQRDLQKNLTSTETPTTMSDRLLGLVSWQMSLGGKEFYASDEANAELRRRQSKLDEETRRITQSVESDFASLQSATLRITTAQTEAAAATAVVEAVQTQLKVGRMGDLLGALDATDRLFSARSRQIQALAQQMTAQSQLLRQMGLLSQVAAKGDNAPPVQTSAP